MLQSVGLQVPVWNFEKSYPRSFRKEPHSGQLRLLVLGQAAPNAHGLSRWRGEWPECVHTDCWVNQVQPPGNT